jgi:hypothetical protein
MRWIENLLAFFCYLRLENAMFFWTKTRRRAQKRGTVCWKNPTAQSQLWINTLENLTNAIKNLLFFWNLNTTKNEGRNENG